MYDIDNSNNDSWAWGFNDVLLTSFAVILVFAVSIIQDYHPEYRVISEPITSCDSTKKRCDSLQYRLNELISNDDDIEKEAVIKSDIPLILSIKWKNNGASNSGITIYILNKATGQYIYKSPLRGSSPWGAIWWRGVDFVPDPDVAFIQEELVPGFYDVFLRVIRSTELAASGFIHANLENGKQQYVELQTMKISSTAVPWGRNGGNSLIGSLRIEKNKIVWLPKS